MRPNPRSITRTAGLSRRLTSIVNAKLVDEPTAQGQRGASMTPKITYRRHRGVLSAMMVTLILTLAVVLGSGSPATAADLELPAGVACDFALNVDILGGNQVMKEFTDKNGNVVRRLSAGKGSELFFVNVETGATLSLTTGGSVRHTTVHPVGSETVETVTDTGHTVLIFLPTDVPAGPSTTLYLGRVVYTVDKDGNATLQEVHGKTTDICAALSD
jgi:hypothetical protein